MKSRPAPPPPLPGPVPAGGKGLRRGRAAGEGGPSLSTTRTGHRPPDSGRGAGWERSRDCRPSGVLARLSTRGPSTGLRGRRRRRRVGGTVCPRAPWWTRSVSARVHSDLRCRTGPLPLSGCAYPVFRIALYASGTPRSVVVVGPGSRRDERKDRERGGSSAVLRPPATSPPAGGPPPDQESFLPGPRRGLVQRKRRLRRATSPL